MTKPLHWLLGYWISTCVMTMQNMVEATGCPPGCSCYGINGSTELNVQCLQATSVPSIWPDKTSNIDIRFSKKPKNGIPPGAFAHMHAVKSISLRGPLGTLHSSAFYNLTGRAKSSKLSFWDCDIGKVQMSAFNQISGYNITFSSCKIKSFKAGSLYQVNNIDLLDMWSVSIEEIFERAFAGLSNVKTFSLRQSTIDVIYNYGFTGIHNVQSFSTPGLRIKLCMGKYAFVGMEGVEPDFTGAEFPLTPITQSTSSEDNDILTCANGWRIPENSVWFYRNRVTVMLVLGFIFSALFIITAIICCLRCRRNSRRGRGHEAERTGMLRQWTQWIRAQISRRRTSTSADQPDDEVPSASSDELDTTQNSVDDDLPFSRLPSYEDCSKMAPPYSPATVPHTPPPCYASFIALEHYNPSSLEGATCADYSSAIPSFSFGERGVDLGTLEDAASSHA